MTSLSIFELWDLPVSKIDITKNHPTEKKTVFVRLPKK